MVTRILDGELDFTKSYIEYKDSHPAIREAMCLKTMFKYYFTGIQEGDLFAGRVKYGAVGFGLENTTGGSLYYCRPNRIRKMLGAADVDESYKNSVMDMLDFWKGEFFLDQEGSDDESEHFGKMLRALPKDVYEATTNRIADMGGRLAGTYMNYEKLMKLGIPGLSDEVKKYRAKAVEEGSDTALYDAMLISLESLADICKRYALEARELAAAAEGKRKDELAEMAAVLDKIAVSKPGTLREGIQLMWLYTLAAETVNYGRMDVYLGDLYVSDLNRGTLTEERALEMLQCLWRLIVARRIAANEISEFNARVVVGGKGRPNEANADKFAILAMEASRTVIETEPQLTMRIYKGMNPALMKKAMDVIGEGRVYPMLYNDDVNIPAVIKAFNVPYEDAEQYLPYGCGEYGIDHMSVGSPNCSLNLLKALEVTLHNGKNALTGEDLGLKTGDIKEFDTFEKLFDAYKKQVEFYTANLAKRQAIEYQVEKENAAFLFVSMLYDNCLEKGRSIVDRGAKYTGGIIESFAIVNTADSLTTIKELVYDKKLMTLEELVKILDANFEGYEKEHRLFISTPKFGNDIEVADSMVELVSSHACIAAQDQAEKNGFDYYLIVNINNYYNVELGKVTGASADGRVNGAPLANGNTPTAGMDKNGITAFLNSLSKINPDGHAGYSHNMKFSKQMFNQERKKTEMLLNTYFAKGGTQAMLTVVNKEDLENAMKEPEKYGNLIVRVGGFSARFVELSREVQLDVLNRTLY